MKKISFINLYSVSKWKVQYILKVFKNKIKVLKMSLMWNRNYKLRQLLRIFFFHLYLHEWPAGHATLVRGRMILHCVVLSHAPQGI